jgi:hypothetical protein
VFASPCEKTMSVGNNTVGRIRVVEVCGARLPTQVMVDSCWVVLGLLDLHALVVFWDFLGIGRHSRLPTPLPRQKVGARPGSGG